MSQILQIYELVTIRMDGLELSNVYITSVVRCAPSNNLPLVLK
jgi:hypothetical protein